MARIRKIRSGLIGGVVLYIINVLRTWIVYNLEFPQYENGFLLLDLFGAFVAIFLILYKQTTTKDSIINACAMMVVWNFIEFWGERYILNFLNIKSPYDSNGYGMLIGIYMIAITAILVLTILVKAFVRFCKGY